LAPIWAEPNHAKRPAAKFVARERLVFLICSDGQGFERGQSTLGTDRVEEGYDLVIRVNPDPDDALVGRAFLRDRSVVVASPGLTPPTDGSLAPAVVRGPVDRLEVWRMATPAGGSTIAINPILSLSSMIMVRDAVRAGVGAGRLPIARQW
jgi:DNA-binding transcriptional LysR family regulator